MGNLNRVQEAILELEGGAFQNIFDRYLVKKYKFKNIQTLGVQTGTNKPTKGVPDSYVLTDEGKYILINYGTVKDNPVKKIKDDILVCFDQNKLPIPKEKIAKIICGHSSTNIHLDQFEDIRHTIGDVEIELIGIDTLSMDLVENYPYIVKEELGISIDSGQFFDIEDFVEVYDANGINAPIDCDFFFRESEMAEVLQSIDKNKVTIMTGPSGIGKTRLAVEVCRKLENEGMKVYCVKSNGNWLYEDIKRYLSDPGKYLIFFDDANMIERLDNVLNELFSSPKKYEVNVLITVREYAQTKVINAANNYSKPNIIKIERFEDDEIEEILKKNLNIVNSKYLNRITEIADGNIRLAVLAGKISADKGLLELRNAEDIFKNYYGRIINDTKLSKDDILMLFFIAAAGPVRQDMNPFYDSLKKKYGKTISGTDTIENLYRLELVDWFKNEITKISDQSFGNYILYYVLYEKRWIKIEDFISIGFPNDRWKVGYALKTLINIFYSEELFKYVKDSIISAWDHAPADQEDTYMDVFGTVDPYRTLSFLKSQIDQEEEIKFDLHTYDIDSKKNNSIIKSNIIKILGRFKHTYSFEDAFDLLLVYYSKRPDLFMDFYFMMCDHLLFDEFSLENEFQGEKILLEKLWERTEEGTNYNDSILYIHIAESALNIQKSFTRSTRSRKKITFETVTFSYNEAMGELRKTIFGHFGVLRKKEEYRDKVNRILLSIHFKGLENNETKKYLKGDFDTIYEQIINKENPDFFDAQIVEIYETTAGCIGAEIDSRYLIAEKNPEYKIWKLLSIDPMYVSTRKEEKEIRKKLLSTEISSYTVDDFHRMFRTCCFLERVISRKEHWSIKSGLECVFEILEDDPDLYIQALIAYLEENAPFTLKKYDQVDYLLNHVGYEGTLSLVKEIEFDKKDEWISVIWECLPEDKISEQVMNDFKDFTLRMLGQENPAMPSVQVVSRYIKGDRDFKEKIIEAIIACPELSVSFLCAVYDDKDIEVILFFFRDNLEALATIYINVLSRIQYMDYDGGLFIKIFEKYPMIWNKYIDWLEDHIDENSNEQSIIEYIWLIENWYKYINYTFEALIEDKELFYIKEYVQLLFGLSQNELVMERKKKWLLNYLQENSMDIKKIKVLFEIIVNVLPEWKIEFTLEFLKQNKSFEDFKELSLFPSLESWTGSEIPLIMEKIDYLKFLQKNLKGIHYIEHRNYLEKWIRNLENYKEETEKREYIEDAYA